MSPISFNAPHIIVALDNLTIRQIDQLIEQFSPEQCRLKVGKALFVSGGSHYVKKLVDQGFSIFLDLKFHDIPNTVAQACRAAADLGVWMIDVHALGGLRMLEAAKNALVNHPNPPLLVAVTVLTSMDSKDLIGVGLSGDINAVVEHLAVLAKQAGLDGVVCSAQEARYLRQRCGDNFCLVTPGIRLSTELDSDTLIHKRKGEEEKKFFEDDQKRIVTPQQAIDAGSNYLVIGRPITGASKPREMLQKILEDTENK